MVFWESIVVGKEFRGTMMLEVESAAHTKIEISFDAGP